MANPVNNRDCVGEYSNIKIVAASAFIVTGIALIVISNCVLGGWYSTEGSALNFVGISLSAIGLVGTIALSVLDNQNRVPAARAARAVEQVEVEQQGPAQGPAQAPAPVIPPRPEEVVRRSAAANAAAVVARGAAAQQKKREVPTIEVGKVAAIRVRIESTEQEIKKLELQKADKEKVLLRASEEKQKAKSKKRKNGIGNKPEIAEKRQAKADAQEALSSTEKALKNAQNTLESHKKDLKNALKEERLKGEKILKQAKRRHKFLPWSS